jgi:hypothetical protein
MLPEWLADDGLKAIKRADSCGRSHMSVHTKTIGGVSLLVAGAVSVSVGCGEPPRIMLGGVYDAPDAAATTTRGGETTNAPPSTDDTPDAASCASR